MVYILRKILSVEIEPFKFFIKNIPTQMSESLSIVQYDIPYNYFNLRDILIFSTRGQLIQALFKN